MLFKLFTVLCRPLLERRRRSSVHALQLRAMSDLELRDLGMGRSEIPAMLSAEAQPHAEESWGNRP
ncbi:hypothetical protein [Undibacterium sp.]|jgi:uncharacterized protein YjiS (DUF1127 family)|uniref:hypothetical protein n=1 Tax=Undibacterium sp. TaxID=1914977 RepID=UPI002B5A8440|nr:hypothetical protein [Undibacterium sp.]HTD03515.1 hypothetical protein [Undibacterium sp.]